MSELLKKKRELTKVEEGILIKQAKPIFDYFVVSSNQLQKLGEAAAEAASLYNAVAKSVFGPLQTMFKVQEQIAKQISMLTKIYVGAFEKINFIFPIPTLDPNIFPKDVSLPVYVQPDKPYIPIKQIQLGKKKEQLPISAIEIESNGFVLQGEYIRGLTLKSQTGRLLELMVRKDIHGTISDDMIGEATDKKPNDYQAWGNVFRDLKDILLDKNKLKLDVERYPALKKYQVLGLTKYLRKPRKNKKPKNKAKVD